MGRLLLVPGMVVCGSALLVAALVLSVPFDPIDDCLDDGGRWVYEVGECECSYTQRGHTSFLTVAEYEACRILPVPTAVKTPGREEDSNPQRR